MKEIPLSNSDKKAIVDDEDYELVMKYNWHLNNAGYAQTSIKGKSVLMHRMIMDAMQGQEIDHKEQDNRMNCRRENLRFCNHSQNIANDGPRKNNKLGIKGVDELRNGRFRATIRVNYRKIFIGTYNTIKEAAIAWNEAAKIYFGEFAYQNNLEELP